MDMAILSDYRALLALLTFIASFATFSRYLADLERKLDGRRAPISRTLSRILLRANVCSVALTWMGICVAVVASAYEDGLKVLMEIFVAIPVLCLTATTLNSCFAWFINDRIMTSRKDRGLPYLAIEDLNKLINNASSSSSSNTA
jgi:hypothetical protein